MARKSLSILAAMLALLAIPSCLAVSAPDDIRPATTTRPTLSNLDPDPFSIWIIPRTNVGSNLPATFERKSLSFDIVSEDLNSGNLQAAIVLDYQGEANPNSGTLVGQDAIAPGHIDDPEPRHVESIDFNITTGTRAGCHSLTLIVTHDFLYGFKPARENDVAYAVWWLDVDDDITTPTASLARCSAAFPDAGAGAR